MLNKKLVIFNRKWIEKLGHIHKKPSINENTLKKFMKMIVDFLM